MTEDIVSQSLPHEIGAHIQEHLEACPKKIAREIAADILESFGNFPDDSAFLSGKPAVLFSGGGLGVDAAFAKAANEAGHIVTHWLGPNMRACKSAEDLNGGNNICRLSLSELRHPRVTAALDRCAQIRCGASSFEDLCQKNPSYAERDERLRKYFFQVARATAVYVVAHRPSKADDPGLPPLDIGGDAGWAAQMYIDRFSPAGEEENSSLRLFLFDNAEEGNPEHLNDVTTARRWTFWQAPTSRNSLKWGKWTEFGQPMPALHQTAASVWKAKDSPPPPSGIYACLGTPKLNWSCTGHAEALVQVYNNAPEEKKPRKGRGKGKPSTGIGQESALPEMDL